MTNYDVTPVGSTLSPVRLYGDSMELVPRSQPHNSERHAVIAAGGTASDSAGIEPGDVLFRGTWLGSDAGALADRWRAILDDTSIEEVDVQAVDNSGADVTSSYNGRYRLAEEQTLEQIIPGDESAYRYQINLLEG